MSVARLAAVAIVVLLGLSSTMVTVEPARASISGPQPNILEGSETPTFGEQSSDLPDDTGVYEALSDRTIQYKWYDMFNVPFKSYWDVRWQKTGIEQPMTDAYPYIYLWHGAPVGNTFYYSDCRLNVTARLLTQINMNERPEFLPFLGTQRGGNAELDWQWEYLTDLEVSARFPPTTAAWNDGWFLRTWGTTTLDKQAAMAVIGITEDGYNSFATWWSVNNYSIKQTYLSWLKNEGNSRLDIYPMYEYSLTFLDWNFWATKEGEDIVLHYDYVTWGMEALMTRWLHEAFMPTEWYFYDASLHASIGSYWADVDLDAAVMRCLYAYESTLLPIGETHGTPCWVWEALMQDYVASSIAHPHSDMDPYKPFSYSNTAPGSEWYGRMMPYDYTPGAWNLSEGESLTFEWPAGEQRFIAQSWSDGGAPLIGETTDEYAEMAVTYSEPNETDLPWNVAVDRGLRTITFTGPMDMWGWSKGQTSHPWLASEWDRLGILPYGVPYLEFGMASPVPPGPKIDYRLYDMFEPEFGEWMWTKEPWGRMVNYYNDYIIWNETGKHAWLYIPKPDQNDRSLVYAPYRWSMKATNIDWVTVDHPYVMPTCAPVAGAEATIDLTFNYLTRYSWENYWIPTWGWIRPDHPWNESTIMRMWFTSQCDGYQLGVMYNITLNREAAHQWLGIPLEADVAAWYGNGQGTDFMTYQSDWWSWLDNEANNRLDIYSGYDDLFYLGFNWMKVEEVAGTGDVRLTIAEVDWGYEVLMTRWLSEAKLNPSEPWWEDFKLKASLTEAGSNISFDAVGMYNLHAVKANQTSTNAGAWAWEPTHIDYVPSWDSAIPHPSEYDSYAYRTYTSWDSGNTETFWGQEVPYPDTPTRFNMTNYMTLTVNLPTGPDVPFLLGQPVPTGSVDRLRTGDSADYDSLKYTGSATLGFSVPDLSAKYIEGTKTLTVRGPLVPNNPSEGVPLYHGAPWIEVDSVISEPREAFAVSLSGVPTSAWPGESISATVTVLDQYLEVYSDFRGTVALSSSDPLAILPEPYSYTWADAGTHVFEGIVLMSPGLRSVTARVVDDPSLNATRTVDVMGNTPPVASFTVTPDHGQIERDYVFDASSSYDAESSLLFRWDFGNDGVWDLDWSSEPTLTVYPMLFTACEILLEVMDGDGFTDQATGFFSAGIYVHAKVNQKAKATWTYMPEKPSNLSIAFDNSGLKGVTLDVVDITTGTPIGVHHERIRFLEANGVYSSEGMVLLAYHEYLFTAVPLGQKGTFALAYGSQLAYSPAPLVVQPSIAMSHHSAWADDSGVCSGELIVSHDRDWAAVRRTAA